MVAIRAMMRMMARRTVRELERWSGIAYPCCEAPIKPESAGHRYQATNIRSQLLEAR
jgi:hypothetical protein